MPRTKKKSESKNADRKQRAEMLKAELRNRYSNFSFPRSYTSLVYGVITLVVLFALGFAAVRLFTQGSSPDIQDGIDSEVEQANDNEYIVDEGETLWSIAEQEYNDGYAWSKIAEANNLNNPDNLEAGTRLTLPERNATPEAAEDVQPEVTVTRMPSPTAATEQTQPTGERITGSQYTVVEGDTLWDISIRAYGNGYRWPEIAQANGLVNPDLIYVGTKLSLQR